MSLHDVGKDQVNRGSPQPNANDQVNQYLAQGTTQNQNSIEEATADGLKFLERQIIAKQSGFNKAAFGFYGDANKFGLKVAEDGVDVLTATDDQLVFNSEQNLFKIIQSGNLSYSVAAYSSGDVKLGSSEVDTGISSSSPLIVIGFTENGGSYRLLPTGGLTVNSTDLSISFVTYTQVSSYISGGTLRIVASTHSFSGIAFDVSVRYYLLQETAA